MSNLIKTWILNMLSLWIIDYFSASVGFADLASLAVTSIALTLLNKTIKPLLNVLSLPLNVLTLGLFSFVINGVVLYAAFSFSSGSSIASFGTAIWMSVILAVINGILEKVFD